MRRAKNAVKGLLAKGFHLGQRLGWDVLPRHFYSEIPDVAKLRRTTAWRKPYSMAGVAGADLDEQEAFVRSVVTPALTDRLRPGDVHPAACARNGEAGYGPIEADFLFAFVATARPARIVQIGCGVSTAVCLHAATEAGYRPEIVCVEPYPTAFLRAAAAAGDVTLVPRPVEDVGAAVVDALAAGDLLFVDSSHTLGPAGEVSRIVLEFLPRLRAGVRVHFHDILFPYDYPRAVLTDALFFWHESALLHAFLVHNRRFRLLASLAMLHYGRPGALGELLTNYRPQANDDGLAASPGHFPSAAYLQVTE
jgi:hypothetical protein